MKKTPLDLHAEKFIRDYPRGMYKPIVPTTSKEKNTVKQVRTPRRVIKRGANVK
tara:strand:+ start:105 stop:266 length:162 start_codon:yes stop_codon:yes gene_type:complete